MKKFSYEARDKVTGKIEKSEIQAETEMAAGRILLERGLIPTRDLKEVGQGSFLERITTKISTKDKIVFTRQFSTLIGAGLPLSQGLRTVAEQTDDKKMRSVVDDITASVEGGSTLSDSFSKHPQVFDKVYLALISAGEISGTLDESLKRIAIQQEKDAAMMSKIRGAMMYPMIVLVVIGLVMGFLMFTVVPQVEQLYVDMKKELPFLTQMMVATANFLMSSWWIIALVVVGLGVIFSNWLKTDAGVRFLARFKLNVPIFSGLFRKLYMARFCRTGQLLLSTGVSMVDMLGITSDAVNNVVIKDIIMESAEKVSGGKNLSDSLKGKDYILPLVPQMISIGEESGKIDEMLGKTAQVYEDELDEQIKAISTMIEPILMVVMAIMAGGMIGAILFPIYSLVQGI